MNLSIRNIALLGVMTMWLVAGAALHPQKDGHGRWGYVDDSNNIVLKHRYDEAGEFDDGGLARVCVDGKYGFIDPSGKFVIPCKFKYAGQFNNNGLVWVNEGGKIEKDDKNVSGGKFYVYDRNGKMFFDKAYAVIGEFVPWHYNYADYKLEKMTATEQALTRGADYTFWRKQTFDLEPDSKLPDDVHAYFVSMRGDSHWNGVVAPTGNIIVYPGDYYFANCPENGICIVHNAQGNVNFLKASTRGLVFKHYIDSSWGFDNGYCIGGQGGLEYIFDAVGQKRSDGYTKIYPKNSGVHVVRNGKDKYGLIKDDGTELLPTNNYSVYPCTEGLALVKPTSSSKIGYVDINGKWVIEPDRYSDGELFINGKARVCLDGQWGEIDKEGNVVKPFTLAKDKSK